VNKFGCDVIFKIKTNNIKKIDVHRIIGVFRPWYFIKSAVVKPKFGNSQVMNQGITGYGGSNIQDEFNA
jgi:hypothetical protein